MSKEEWSTSLKYSFYSTKVRTSSDLKPVEMNQKIEGKVHYFRVFKVVEVR